jgi:hypothetical protein
VKPHFKLAAVGVGFLIAAVFGLYWAQSYMDSLYAFRSPLKDTALMPGAAPVEAKTRRLVIVLIDGLRLDTAQNPAVMPFLDQLRKGGASAEMHSRPPTYSTPSYVVIMTGAWPSVSDGPAMNLEYEEIPEMTQDQIFAIARRAGHRTAISSYNWFEKLIPASDRTSGFFTAGEDHAADQAVMAAAEPWLADAGYGLVLIHLDQVDYAGHYEGGGVSAHWDAAATRVDSMLRETASHLDFTKDTMLVISDHGHIDPGGHGGQDQVTLVEPFVLVGAGVKPGVYEPVQMVDIAPTAAVLLGGNLPAAAQGRALAEMLTLTPAEMNVLRSAELVQQSQLLAAYTAAIAQEAPAIQGGDPVPSHQAALEIAQNTRLNRERVPRLILALTLLAVPLIWILRIPWRQLLVLLAGVGVYALVFHARYSWLDQKTYSLSSVPSASGFLIHTATTTLLAFLAAALVVALLSQRTGILRPGPAVLGFAGLLLYGLALPTGYSFGINGNTFTWILPDYGTSFLSFLATAQMLFAGAAGALAAFGMAAASIRKPAGRKLHTPAAPPV